MCRYPPITIDRYLDLPSTQRIQIHIPNRHNATPPLQTLVQAPTHSTPTPPTPSQPKHRHTFNIPPVTSGLVKPKPNPLNHSPPSPPTPPLAKHIHISHTSPTPLNPSTTLIHITSAAQDTILEPHVPPTCPARTTTTPYQSPTPALHSPSHSLNKHIYNINNDTRTTVTPTTAST